MSADLYLVRHGEAAWNAAGRYCGRSESPLTPAGERQAEALAAWIRHLDIAAVYSSPLERAVGTARRIAEALDRPLRIRPALTERDYGAWEGLTTEEIVRRWPELYARFKEDPAAHTPPGGEACARVVRRVRAALLALARVHSEEAVAVVSHKTALRVFLAPLLGVALRDYNRELPMANAAVTLLRVEGTGARVIWYNRTSHLGAC